MAVGRSTLAARRVLDATQPQSSQSFSLSFDTWLVSRRRRRARRLDVAEGLLSVESRTLGDWDGAQGVTESSAATHAVTLRISQSRDRGPSGRLLC